MRWAGFRPLFDFWGAGIKRFYKLETLASATERLLQGHDTFIAPSIQRVLGPSPLTSLTFELFQEGKYQLIFRLTATNVKRKRGVFAYVAAKNHTDFTALAKAEHHNLRILNERAPKHVVRPFLGGNVFLPDRHRRRSHDREIYAYVTQWLSGFHELGVNKELQFFVNVENRQVMSVAQTEALKAKAAGIIARTYDPKDRSCMEMPQVASGDFVVTKPSRRGTPQLKLIACRNMLRRVSPAKLVHEIVSARWRWGDRDFYLCPADSAMLRDGLKEAVGGETALDWLRQYRDAVVSRKLPERTMLPVADLEALLG